MNEYNPSEHDSFLFELDEILSEIRAMLAEKNKNYGNSALDPVRIFSKAGPDEQMRVRLDDKLSRLARGEQAGEDVVKDIMGYLVLMRIAENRNKLKQLG